MVRWMRRLVVLPVVVTAVAVATPTPAGATTTVTSSGTTVTATMAASGYTALTFSCVGGGFRAGGVAATPPIGCGTVTKVTVIGDADTNFVDGSGLTLTRFPALTGTVVSLGGGYDVFTESPVADLVAMGPGSDTVVLRPWAANATDFTYQLGGDDYDTVSVEGTAGNDSINASSDATTVTVSVTAPSGTRSRSVQGADHLTVSGGTGDDSISSAGLAPDSPIERYGANLYGGDGDDTVTAGPQATGLWGGTGTNTLIGGSDTDNHFSESPTDTILPNNGPDGIQDIGGRMGGRTYQNLGGGGHNWAYQNRYATDDSLRIRPEASNGVRVTSGLGRPGSQSLPSQFAWLVAYQQGNQTSLDRSVVDTQALAGQKQEVYGDNGELVDVIVPSGTWTVTGTPTDDATITFTGGYKEIRVAKVAALSVHAPFADANTRFAHNVVRDLQFRFAGVAERNALRDRLNAGTTRATIARELIGTDAYRGLDVDRAFIDVLRRNTDTAGRNYWIGRIRSGTSLRLVRASLLGSAEYYSKFGGSTDEGWINAAYSDVLGRVPDASGLAYWKGVLATTTRATVAQTFLKTAEARRAVVTKQFWRFVDRAPTTAEASGWAATLGSSATGEQQLVEFLAASLTYYWRA